MRKVKAGDRVQCWVNVLGGEVGGLPKNLQIKTGTVQPSRSGLYPVLIDGDKSPAYCFRADLAILPKVDYLTPAQRMETSKLIIKRQYEGCRDHEDRVCSCGTGQRCGY